MTEKVRPSENELTLGFDPELKAHANLAFIGKLSSNWSKRDCPKNLTEARASVHTKASVQIEALYCAGLQELEVGTKIWLVLWFDRTRRDIIVRAPRNSDSVKGAFTLRRPARPNPISIRQ